MASLKLYITSHKDGRLLGVRDADTDPMNQTRKVIPPYQTTKAPETLEVLSGKYWAFLDENSKPVRSGNGTWVLMDEDVETYAYHKVTKDVRPFPSKTSVTEDYTTEIPPSKYHVFSDNMWVEDIAEILEAKIREVKMWRLRTEYSETAKVEALGYVWDADPESRKRVESALISSNPPAYWTDADNHDHEGISSEELFEVKSAIDDFLFSIHDRQKRMKSELKTLQKFEEIANYTVGW